MPRRKNSFTTGHYYHVYNRGANRERIFFSEENYLYLLRLVKKYYQKYQIAIIAYCLMPNHYHFLLRQDGETSIGHFVGVLFNAYAQAVNRQNGRTGALFEGRFKDVYVEDEAYLLHLCRYIHGNPVKAGLVTTLEEWPYSNYLEWIGERPGKLVDDDFVTDFFPNRMDYKEFVLDYLRGIDDLPPDIEQYLFADPNLPEVPNLREVIIRETHMHQSKIFLVDKSGQTWLPMTEMPYDQEVVLQEALAQYPDLIPGDQINPDNPRRWLLVKRELGVPGETGGGDIWSLDHLFLDQDGMPTFIECKRSQDTRGRREVVAQMLDYAANGTEYWPMEKLRQSAAETAQQQGTDLDEAIVELLDDSELDVEWFWQQVESNLRQGKIRLVFVADAIPKELRRLVEFLNAKMNDVEVLAVEVKQFLGEGQRAMVPRVIGITEATRQAKQASSSRSIINQEIFLQNCLPETAEFYNQVISRVLTAGHKVSWGTKGFSMRMQGNGRLASFGYCFPPNTFDLYLGEFKHTDLPTDVVENLRMRLMANGLLAQRGQQTLRAEVTPRNEQDLLALLEVMLQTIELEPSNLPEVPNLREVSKKEKPS